MGSLHSCVIHFSDVFGFFLPAPLCGGLGMLRFDESQYVDCLFDYLLKGCKSDCKYLTPQCPLWRKMCKTTTCAGFSTIWQTRIFMHFWDNLMFMQNWVVLFVSIFFIDIFGVQTWFLCCHGVMTVIWFFCCLTKCGCGVLNQLR